MPTSLIEIRPGLSEHLREEAARIHYAAFGQKFAPILDERAATPVLAPLLDPERMLAAFCGNQLVGFAGMQYAQRPLFRWRLAPFVRAFGRPRGFFKYVVCKLFIHQHCPPDQLLLEWICVDVAWRGKGVGQQLLAALFDFARARGYRAVRLGVVDTNRDARRLYERLGFVPVETHHYPLLRRIVGFSAETIMVKNLVRN